MALDNVELARAERQKEVARQLMELGRKCVEEAPAEWLTRDFDAELYGEEQG